MKLEKYLDHELRKDTMDVVIQDEAGNDISSTVSSNDYAKLEVLNVRYELIAFVTTNAERHRYENKTVKIC